MTSISRRWSHKLLMAFAASACMAGFFTSPGAAEIRKVALICNGNICPVFLPELPLPKGWQVDKQMSDANQIEVLTPDGDDFGSAEAIIYGKAFFNNQKLTIQSRVETSNKHWLDTVKDAKIERLPDVLRTKGGSPFQLYRYLNPSADQQAAEIVAFGEDIDKEGNPYGVQVVVTARDEAGLEHNKQAFMDVLTNY